MLPGLRKAHLAGRDLERVVARAFNVTARIRFLPVGFYRLLQQKAIARTTSPSFPKTPDTYDTPSQHIGRQYHAITLSRYHPIIRPQLTYRLTEGSRANSCASFQMSSLSSSNHSTSQRFSSLSTSQMPLIGNHSFLALK